MYFNLALNLYDNFPALTSWVLGLQTWATAGNYTL